MTSMRRFKGRSSKFPKYGLKLLILTIFLGVYLITWPLDEVIAGPEPNIPDTSPHDTSIIVSSNLIPSHPSIKMISEMIHSIHKYVKGIRKDVPIYVTIDGLSDKRRKDADNVERHQQYIQNLRKASFAPFTNVHIVPMPQYFHLAGSVNYTLNNFVDTEFVFLTQHDLPFCRSIDYTRVIQAMKMHPKTLYNVRFRTKENDYKDFLSKKCNLHNYEVADYPKSEYLGLNFYAMDYWSDQNHISTKSYYIKMMNKIAEESLKVDPNRNATQMFMEEMMIPLSAKDCVNWGQQIYGKRNSWFNFYHVKHLFGRGDDPYE